MTTKLYNAEETLAIHVTLFHLTEKAERGEDIDRQDIINELFEYGLEDFDGDLVEVILDYLTQFD